MGLSQSSRLPEAFQVFAESHGSFALAFHRAEIVNAVQVSSSVIPVF
ncbi:Unknown protein sequence [Pseudomonas amygdali pv. lachrymans]|nr:Unknown protein sequence [Pseudomonas amygdali pv. lachrymans]